MLVSPLARRQDKRSDNEGDVGACGRSWGGLGGSWGALGGSWGGLGVPLGGLGSPLPLPSALEEPVRPLPPPSILNFFF